MPWWGPGWGRGFGWRWCFWLTGKPGWMRWSYPSWHPYHLMKPEDELEILEEMKKDLEAELEDIRRRIEELRKDLTE